MPTIDHTNRDLPPAQGLYHPRNEHDACGLNFVCDMHGRQSHEIVAKAIGALCNLEHRGARGADINTGDGAGILIQVPDRFFRDVVAFELPEAGAYATGMAFLPQDPATAEETAAQVEAILDAEGLEVLGWRDVPVDESILGTASLMTMPIFRQVFVSARNGATGIDLDRMAFIARKRIERGISVNAGPDEANEAMGGVSEAHDGVYMPSLSARTFVYKGMLTTPQVAAFYPDLVDERVESAMALVHSRFSTNTFPSWPLAHPYRIVAHNGEINTIQGNRNWMRAREALLDSPHLPGLERAFPICTPGASDTAGFDEALELLSLGGYSLAEAVLMMIPEPWEHHEEMDAERKAFYQYNATRMEPWDGPASIAFTDGTVMGAVLDRNGLRPSRYWVTKDGLVVMASEVGVVDLAQDTIVEKGRLQPGRMFLIDTREGRIIRDHEVKAGITGARPYAEWIESELVTLADLPAGIERSSGESSVTQLQQEFGYSLEEKKLLISPMARDGKEAIGSMGTDTPIAVLSDRSRHLSDYFQQLFAQVTNPPLDAIREEIITSLFARVGPEGNLFDPVPASCRTIHLDNPVITDAELARIITLDGNDGPDGFRTAVLGARFDAAAGAAGLAAAIEQLRGDADAAIADGATVLVISDRGTGLVDSPIPSLLACSAVHHHLVRNKTRTQVGLVIEAGDVREVHHIGTLLGYGANAINPYLAFATIDEMIAEGEFGLGDLDPATAHANYIKAAGLGILKIMSKMGISTVASYTGAQIFEAIGLSTEVVDEYFTGTVSRLGGVGLDVLAEAVKERQAKAFPENPTERAHRTLEVGGQYQWRREGEYHLFNPDTVFKLQHATREGRYDIFKEYTALVDDQSERLGTLRGLFKFKFGEREPISIDQVESAENILKRFSTGAMSYGSISAEAHETLAIAMNRLGAKSNTGEGGEDADRFTPDDNGDLRRSAIKQAASGRFGVTSEYLVNADDIQIKMAQGAKPGEGGQLPGHKVYPWIAKTRHSTPGVGLISPPPHHDIYSIEDLAQLIHDLKNANPKARIHVKLVAEVGVGTVAAGVSKAHADVVLISGHDGGTGASPQTSIKHAGAPWELGLAETQQTLLLNDLRDRIVVQTDGQLKTGRDVVIAALLGAEEFGFATAPLVVMGCVMMRVCHLDTCPVGVATQNPELREKFSGEPEFVENFFEYIAEEVRELLAELGFRTLDEAIGQVEMLDTTEAVDHWKAEGLDLSPILHLPEIARESRRHQWKEQDHGLELALDQTLIQLAEGALQDGRPVTIDTPIRNVNRTVGTLLGFEVTQAHGGEGLPDDTIVVNLTGSAGNSLGAFVPRGITLRLEGDANDYVGKGLSGGRIVVRPPREAPFVAEDNVIAGNVIGYGATGGEMFLRGIVGERFCVRNSGATVVAEGVGDHACEYMTGGRAVVLGPTGRNFAAGMSGGSAFVYDPDGLLPQRTNHEMVALEVPDADDLDWLRERVELHGRETDSAVAAALLADWNTASAAFVKVMPTDFKRVLEAAAAARAEGRDETEAVMAAARV
ncbi:MAG: glutamate synthase large subunit [Actinomycetota bacterium]